jgi:beta-glucosidase
LDAIKKSAKISALEASAGGIHWTFAPMVDVARDPRWGRVMEGAGEDVFLGSQIAIARVQGIRAHSFWLCRFVLFCMVLCCIGFFKKSIRIVSLVRISR